MATPAPTTFDGLSDADLACMYRALSVYLGSEDSGVWSRGGGGSAAPDQHAATDVPPPAQDPERNALFRLGREAQREIDRRGRDALRPVLRDQRDWPFETWDTFQRAVARGRDAPSPRTA